MRLKRLGPALVCLIAVTPSATSAFAAALVEKEGRLEVNWSTLRLRFYGESKAVESDGLEGLKAAEKKAWQDGLAYVSDAVRDLNVAANEPLVTNAEALSQHAKEAARQVATSTFSYNTTYYADGTVRVHLENALPKALEVESLRFRQKEALQTATTHYSGLVLKLQRAIAPRANYVVVDEKGEVLYDVHDMAEEAYRRSLMGKWFKQPSQAELAEVVGRNPVTVTAETSGEGGRLVVKRSEWERALEGHGALLVNGTVALSLP